MPYQNQMKNVSIVYPLSYVFVNTSIDTGIRYVS